jgi:hypothetical protein
MPPGVLTLDPATAAASFQQAGVFLPNLAQSSNQWVNGPLAGVGGAGFDSFSSGSGDFNGANNNPAGAVEYASLSINDATAPVAAGSLFYFACYTSNVGAIPPVTECRFFIMDAVGNVVSNQYTLTPLPFAGVFNAVFTVNPVGNFSLYLIFQVGTGVGGIVDFDFGELYLYNGTGQAVVRQFPFQTNPRNPFFTLVIASPLATDTGQLVIQFLNGGVLQSQLVLFYGDNANPPQNQIQLTPPSDVKTCVAYLNNEIFELIPSTSCIMFDFSAAADTVNITIISGLNQALGKFLTNTVIGLLQTYKG